MNAAPGQAAPPRARRRWPWVLLALCALPLLLWLVAWRALPPERVVPMLLARIGASMNLEISAEGDPSSRLGKRPTFAVRNLVAREPGAATPLLRARLVLVSLPWSTIRSLGDTLDLTRIELEAPVLDLPALQHWLQTRPPSESRLPTLSDGLQVDDGRIDGDGWRIETLQLHVPQLQPGQLLRASARGRYTDDALRAPFDLAATLLRTTSGSGFGIAGTVAPQRDDWHLPAWITLSGMLHWEGGLRLLPARLGTSARYVAGDTSIPFAFGAHGPLQWRDGTLTLSPAGIALRGEGVVPTLDARGALALGEHLVLRLQGRLARWPQAWPTLPPPLGQSLEPLSLSLDYADASDLSGPLQLRVARSGVCFDGRLRIPQVSQWAASLGTGSPLPPIDGRLQAPRIEISGAKLEGVVVEFEDEDEAEAAPADAPTP